MNDHDSYSQILGQRLADLRPGMPRSYEGLCVLPLVSKAGCSAKYVLLEEAISQGTLTITEVSEAGSVPYLAAINKDLWPVLIFDGEELAGAKQNRICNATILVGVGKSVLPVSCVEQGRWRRRSEAFSAGTYTSHPGLRMEKELLVRRSAAVAAARVCESGGARAEAQETRASYFGGAQTKVWEEVSRTQARLAVNSDTAALADSFMARGRDLEGYLRALSFAEDEALDDTVGAVVFFDGRFVCVDLLQPADCFRRLYPKLLRGYALEALVSANKRDFLKLGRIDCMSSADVSSAPDVDPETFALRLFAELKGGALQTQSAADLGEDLRLETATVSGAGLGWNGELIQLSLFPKKQA